jgi:vesicle coat complex subunit
MLLAIKELAVDMSPFVRRTTAYAIPNLNSLEPDMKEELIAVLEKQDYS